MSPSHARLQIALVGAGAMGSLHARVVTQSQDADLACIVDPHVESGELLAERYRTRWRPEVDTLDPFDAVIVATPTHTHVEWGLRVIEAGKPLLVEKPLSEDLAETTRLVEAARRHGVPLMCGLLERYNPAVMTAMEIIEEPVHVTSVRHSPYAPRIVTGVAHDLLIHDVDLTLRMAGQDPSEIKAHFAYCHPKSELGAEDVAEVMLEFRSGLLASLSASRVSQRKVRNLVVAELERLVEIDLLRNDLTVYRHVGNAALDDSGPGYRQQTIIDIPTIQPAREPLATQLDRFVAVARDEADFREELDTLVGPHFVVTEAIRLSSGSPEWSERRHDA
ncbi:MAG: Gfo/Idh/MocA family oxidoreductase [Acidimicrobiia bacterium]|nr:Gfo/Idh/MocA family oxidoreductase [Acidimicrobiia bacterium]